MANKFLDDIKSILEKVFNPKAVAVEATIADIILPGFAPLIDSAKVAIITAEGVAAAAGQQNGTGVQKMAYAVNLFQSTYNAWAAQNGLSQEPAAVQSLLQQVFNLLESLSPQLASASPAPTSAPPQGDPAPSVQTQVKTDTLL